MHSSTPYCSSSASSCSSSNIFIRSSSNGNQSLHDRSGYLPYVGNGNVACELDPWASSHARTASSRCWHPQDVARGAVVATMASLVACGPGLALQWLASALVLDSATPQLESVTPQWCQAVVGAGLAIAAGNWLLQSLAECSYNKQPHPRMVDSLQREAYVASKVESASSLAGVCYQQQRRVASPAWVRPPWQEKKRQASPVQGYRDDLQLPASKRRRNYY